MRDTKRGAAQSEVLGQRVRAARLRWGLSQEHLGELSGLHRTYIGHIERGEVNPSLLNILKVARALNIDASVLVAGLAETIDDPSLA